MFFSVKNIINKIAQVVNKYTLQVEMCFFVHF